MGNSPTLKQGGFKYIIIQSRVAGADLKCLIAHNRFVYSDSLGSFGPSDSRHKRIFPILAVLWDQADAFFWFVGWFV